LFGTREDERDAEIGMELKKTGCERETVMKNLNNGDFLIK